MKLFIEYYISLLASPRFWWVTYTILPTKISEDVRFNQEVFRFDKVTIFLPDNAI